MIEIIRFENIRFLIKSPIDLANMFSARATECIRAAQDAGDKGARDSWGAKASAFDECARIAAASVIVPPAPPAAPAEREGA